MAQFSSDELKNRFGFHPATDQTKSKHEHIRSLMLEVATMLEDILPDGREKALAMTSLQETAMWSNAAVACNLAPLEEK